MSRNALPRNTNASRRPRPSGQPTRGKTALNRLRQVDVYVALAMPGVLRGDPPLVVDLGFGAEAWTTLEMAERWRRIEPSLHVLGVEIDPERVANALPFAEPPATDFALGGFNLADVLGLRQARVVRCYNVLRQYDETEVADALQQIARAVEPGGVLIEGTSNPTGAMVAFDVWRRAEDDAEEILSHEALVFGTNFREMHGPVDFQTILPKRLIHRMMDAEPRRFFDDWRKATAMTRSLGQTGKRENWVDSSELLRERFGWPIDRRKRLAERGYLVLANDLGLRSL